MYNKSMISLEQAQNAIAAMIADFNRDPDRRKVDMAVVDDAGNLLAYARMDRCLSPNPPKRWAVALTPGMMGKGRRTGQARFQ